MCEMWRIAYKCKYKDTRHHYLKYNPCSRIDGCEGCEYEGVRWFIQRGCPICKQYEEMENTVQFEERFDDEVLSRQLQEMLNIENL